MDTDIRENLDQLTQRLTVFQSFLDLPNAPGNYRPTLRRDEPGAEELADAYDLEQAKRFDKRRANVC